MSETKIGHYTFIGEDGAAVAPEWAAVPSELSPGFMAEYHLRRADASGVSLQRMIGLDGTEYRLSPGVFSGGVKYYKLQAAYEKAFAYVCGRQDAGEGGDSGSALKFADHYRDMQLAYDGEVSWSLDNVRTAYEKWLAT